MERALKHRILFVLALGPAVAPLAWFGPFYLGVMLGIPLLIGWMFNQYGFRYVAGSCVYLFLWMLAWLPSLPGHFEFSWVNFLILAAHPAALLLLSGLSWWYVKTHTGTN